MKVLVENDVGRTYHRPEWFEESAAIGDPVVVDRRTAQLIAATPCPTCFPEVAG